MGLFTRRRPATVQAALTQPGGGVQPISHDTWKQLLQLAGYSGSVPATVTRAEALRIPALLNGIKLLCGIAQQLPLVADPVGESDAFLAELDPRVAPGWTVAKTVDSLAFHQVAWWYVTGRTGRGFPRTVEWVAPHRINLANPEKPLLDQVPVAPSDLIRFDGVTEGLLDTGAEALQTALANVRAARAYATNPAPNVILTDADGHDPLPAAEAKTYLDAAHATVKDNGWAYMAGFKLTPVGWSARDLQLVEAREEDAIEMARLLSMPPHYLAAKQGGSTLTYANLGEVRRDLLEVGGLALLLVPIEQRLSMPDITPRGTRVSFDADSFFLRVTPDQPDPDTSQQQANQETPA